MKSIQGMQRQIYEWGVQAFGADHMNNPQMRGIRMLEEAIEFCQAVGVQDTKCAEVIARVYDKSPGNVFQELGGIGLTWLAAAKSVNISAHHALILELDRVISLPPSHFTAREQKKIDLGLIP